MAKKPVKKASKEIKKSSKIDEAALEIALKVMNKGELVELVYEEKDIKIQLKKLGAGMSFAQPAMMAPQTPPPAAAPAAETKEETEHANANVIKSPMVGTFYRAPSPESPPFINVGDKIEPGKTICIIEAMKIMNEIKSEVSGTVKEILVENAQALEFNQPLIVIEK